MRTPRGSAARVEGKPSVGFAPDIVARHYFSRPAEQLKSNHYQYIAMTLKGGFSEPTPEEVRSVTDINFKQTIAQCHVEIALFVKNFLQSPRYLLDPPPLLLRSGSRLSLTSPPRKGSISSKPAEGSPVVSPIPSPTIPDEKGSVPKITKLNLINLIYALRIIGLTIVTEPDDKREYVKNFLEVDRNLSVDPPVEQDSHKDFLKNWVLEGVELPELERLNHRILERIETIDTTFGLHNTQRPDLDDLEKISDEYWRTCKAQLENVLNAFIKAILWDLNQSLNVPMDEESFEELLKKVGKMSGEGGIHFSDLPKALGIQHIELEQPIESEKLQSCCKSCLDLHGETLGSCFEESRQISEKIMERNEAAESRVIRSLTSARPSISNFSIVPQSNDSSILIQAEQKHEHEHEHEILSASTNPTSTVLQTPKAEVHQELEVKLSEAEEEELKKQTKFKLDPNHPDNRGNTALHDAIRTGNADLISMFLAYGARWDLRNAEGQTPFDLAEEIDAENRSKPNHYSRVNLILSFIDKFSEKAHGVVRKGAPTGNTPLHWAIYHGHLGSFRAIYSFFKKKNSNLLTKNNQQENFLTIKNKEGSSISHLIMAEVLPDEDVYEEIQNNLGQNPISQHEAFVKEILDQGLKYIDDEKELIDDEKKLEVNLKPSQSSTQDSPAGLPKSLPIKQLNFSSDEEGMDNSTRNRKIKIDKLFFSKNKKEDYALVTGIRTVKQKLVEREAVEKRAIMAEKIFDEVLLHICKKLEKNNEGSESYDNLSNKLKVVQMAMRDFRGGARLEDVKNGLLQNEDIQYCRNWYQHLIFWNTEKRTKSTAQRLIEKINPAINLENETVRTASKEEGYSSDEHPIETVAARNDERSVNSQMNVLDKERYSVIYKAMRDRAKAAAEENNSKDLALERLAKVDEAFVKIESHVKNEMKKNKPDSADYLILDKKLKLIQKYRKDASHGKMLLTDALKEVVEATDQNKKSIIGHKRLGFWKPKTLVLADAAYQRVKSEQYDRAKEEVSRKRELAL